MAPFPNMPPSLPWRASVAVRVLTTQVVQHAGNDGGGIPLTRQTPGQSCPRSAARRQPLRFAPRLIPPRFGIDGAHCVSDQAFAEAALPQAMGQPNRAVAPALRPVQFRPGHRLVALPALALQCVQSGLRSRHADTLKTGRQFPPTERPHGKPTQCQPVSVGFPHRRRAYASVSSSGRSVDSTTPSFSAPRTRSSISAAKSEFCFR